MLDLATLHRRARRVLPAQIDTRRVVLDAAGEAGLAALLLPLRHRHRGSIVFELSRGTLSALREGSLRFLQEARTAREGLGRRSAPLVYDAWQPVAARPATGFITTSRDRHACLRLDTRGGLAIYAWDDAASLTPIH
ncbi:hypothetical protein [Pseudoxanthomonas sp. PXM02]|jgi:hypothetical protein|uniref:hypothetical protein n=1 Tax=Pseudoxanthomonas sp. PXM02 TaxID=2769294 RepID=UPI0017859E76|nr:hypothetical protein [Pseudoxanthomonas sp. PXM02]MBD9477991.1 hypothetical protein [Pseudoxanthomonas sp. PXM02]